MGGRSGQKPRDSFSGTWAALRVSRCLPPAPPAARFAPRGGGSRPRGEIPDATGQSLEGRGGRSLARFSLIADLLQPRRPLGMTLEGAEVFLTIETAGPSAVHPALNAIPIDMELSGASRPSGPAPWRGAAPPKLELNLPP
jgi:hypothetical protein